MDIRMVRYEDGCFVLAAVDAAVVQVLRQGDTFEVFESGCFQPVQVVSGGYRGCTM